MPGLRLDDKIFVAGHRGLVGSAIVRALAAKGYANVVVRTRAELDLLDGAAVDDFLARERPDAIFDAAAKVGGIAANDRLRADFIRENLAIQQNLIWGAHRRDVRRFVFLGSSCVYPGNLDRPIREEDLLAGPLESTNRPYAVAKIAGLESIDALRRQHGRDYFSVMPTNLYGPGDNFDPENSHVLPALVRKFVEAVDKGYGNVTLWGTGRPRREFLHADDCAAAIVFLAERATAGDLPPGGSHFNVGCGDDLTIAELALEIAGLAGFRGEIRYDPSRPDGTMRKLMDSGRLRALGWSPRIALTDGLRRTLDWFRANQERSDVGDGPSNLWR